MGNPTISVLIPVYNCEKYIEEAIESILNQTYKDFELFVIDDGSLDSTVERIRRFHDTRIRLIMNEEHEGLVKTLNRWFHLPSGKYLARMDADDISAPDRLRMQVEFLEEHPDYLFCGCWLQDFGRSTAVIRPPENYNEICAYFPFRNTIPNGPSMIRLEAFRRLKLQYDDTAPHIEDYEMWSRVYRYGKFYNIPKILYFRRVHGANNTLLNRPSTHEIRQRIRKKLLSEVVPDMSEEEAWIHGVLLDRASPRIPSDLPKMRAWIPKLYARVQQRWGPINPVRLYFEMGLYFSTTPILKDFHGKLFSRARVLWMIQWRLACAYVIGTFLKWD